MSLAFQLDAFQNNAFQVGSATALRLHTDGRYLKNTANELVWLRGTILSDLMTAVTWNCPFGEDIGDRLNLMRSLAPFSNCVTVYIGGTCEDVALYDAAVDEVRNWCVAWDCYFLVKKAGINYTNAQIVANPAPLVNWHLHWVTRYAGVNAFIGCDVWNEPDFTWGEQAALRTVMTAVYNAVHAADTTLLTVVVGAPFTSINQDYIDTPLGHQVVYGWDDYYFHWTTSAWGNIVNFYNTGDYATGYAAMKNLLETNDWRGKSIGMGNFPVMDVESGWHPGDNLVAVYDFYCLLVENDNHFATWQWWPDTSNYGLYTATNVLNSFGEIWASACTGLPVHALSIPAVMYQQYY